MKYKIVLSKHFIIDLNKILQYISISISKQMSKKIAKMVFDKIGVLESFPYIGRISDALGFEDYRIIVIKSNLIFYKVNENEHTVHVYRMLHANADWFDLKNNA